MHLKCRLSRQGSAAQYSQSVILPAGVFCRVCRRVLPSFCADEPWPADSIRIALRMQVLAGAVKAGSTAGTQVLARGLATASVEGQGRGD